MPILLYHSVDDSGSVISVSSGRFKDHMRHLKREGYETISLSSCVKYLSEDVKPIHKMVVLTFDDGFKNNYTEVFPELRKHGFTATVFIPTDYVGQVFCWEGHESVPQLPLLSWDEIREMSNYGIEFGSHTCSHPYLSQLSEDEIRGELVRSKSMIEGKIGKEVEFFCHPYGDWNEQTKRLVGECGYIGAFSRSGFSSVNTNNDLYDLRRVGTGQFSCLEDFKAALLGTYDWYANLKEYLGIRRFRELRDYGKSSEDGGFV